MRVAARGWLAAVRELQATQEQQAEIPAEFLPAERAQCPPEMVPVFQIPGHERARRK